MATGTGKTRTYVKFLKKHGEGKKTLVLMHMNELVEQHATALKDAGLDAGFYTSSVRDLEKDVIVASIPTLSRKNHLEKVSMLKFDYIVVDEAHHTPASTWRATLAAFPGVKRIGLTATPFRPDQQKLDEWFGDITYSVPFRKAQELGIIAQHDAWVVLTDSVVEGGVTSYGDYSKKALDRLFASKDRDDTIVASYKKYGRDGMKRAGLAFKTVCFCINTAHAKRLSQKFKDAGVTSEILVGSTEVQSSADRKRIFAEYKHTNKIEVLCVVGLFNEGVDVPDMGCALMARPTMSNIVYQQQVGRAARLLKGKKEKFILIDYVDNTRKDFKAYTMSNVQGKPPLRDRIVTEYFTSKDPVVVDSRVADIMAPVERFEAGLRMPKGYWSKERAYEEALKYTRFADFQKNGRSAFSALERFGLLQDACAHMRRDRVIRGSWTKDRCRAEALKYKSRVEFREASTAYSTIRRNGWVDELCAHMPPVNGVSKKVKNLDTGQVFESASEATRALGVLHGGIHLAARKGGKAHGYRWAYVDETTEPLKAAAHEPKPAPRRAVAPKGKRK